MLRGKAIATVSLELYFVASDVVFEASCDASGPFVRCQGGATRMTMIARAVVYPGDAWWRVRTCSHWARRMSSMPVFLLFLMTLEIGDALLQLPAPLAAVILETSKREDTAETSEGTSGS
jgi:hypothetical protein